MLKFLEKCQFFNWKVSCGGGIFRKEVPRPALSGRLRPAPCLSVALGHTAFWSICDSATDVLISGLVELTVLNNLHHELAELCWWSAHLHQSDQKCCDRRPWRQYLGCQRRIPGTVYLHKANVSSANHKNKETAAEVGVMFLIDFRAAFNGVASDQIIVLDNHHAYTQLPELE